MIVSNASTLILLAKAELLGAFLAELGERVTVPKEVERECCEEKRTPDALVIRGAIDEKKIAVQPVKATKLYGKIRADFSLGSGEAEALTLAVSRRARLFMTDDKKAIQASKLLKLPFATALGILVRMHEKGLLGKKEALTKLEALRRHGRYSRDIIDDARSRLEAR
ncbi:MAG: hypothetical protein A2W08_06845 [Candidatus Rokubacteria bacterium RBG_16_73_20]|nr:MAG: hypothetical protein A2050_12595 [Candidatus Rokubacteria bacterium GWA2_73_35]OGK93973.1 MAG: hypothetical protein A2W08_06845 [Candidatus Rokubacteria bacterium RBG_16_73_20]HBH02685.1 hypothetical protein [Candidatus Rokubacteria bacterium]